MSRLARAALAGIVFGCASWLDAAAEDPPHAGLEEIVITATRRETSLEDTPLAISAFDRTALEQRELASVQDIYHSVPGMVFGSIGAEQQIAIRGIGLEIPTLSGEPGVAVYVDDVYQGRPFISLAAFHDLERIEVLRGPQGTLYGRNATGGAVRFVTRRPSTEYEADASFQYGSYDQLLGHASVSGPVLKDRLLARLTYVQEDRGGYYKELNSGRDLEDMKTIAFRGTLLGNVTDKLTVEASGDYQRDRFNGPEFWSPTPNFGSVFTDSSSSPSTAPFDQTLASVETSLGAVLGPLRDQVLSEAVGGHRTSGPPNAYNDAVTRTVRDFAGARLKATMDFDVARLSGIYGFATSNFENIADSDGTDLPIFSLLKVEDSTQHSFELQLASPGTSKLNWIGGVYFYREVAGTHFFGPLFGFDAITALPPISTNDGIFFGDGLATVDFTVHRQQTRSAALFANVDYTLFDLVRVHGGARYTKDSKSFLESFRALPLATTSCQFRLSKARWSDTSFKGGVDLLATENIMFYGSYTQAFKAGGFNATGCGDQYDPEFVDAFEGGMKADLFDRRARLNVTGFDYSYQNIQTVRTTLVTQEVINGPKAKMHGVEVEAAASPFQGLAIDATFAWLNAEYTKFTDDDSLTPAEGPRNLAGNHLPKTPELTMSVGGQYTLPVWSFGDLTGRYEYSHTDGYYFTAFNERVERQRAYGMSNAFLIFDHAGGSFSVKGFVKNIEEEYVRTGVIPTAPIGGYLVNFGPPRTWGAELTLRY